LLLQIDKPASGGKIICMRLKLLGMDLYKAFDGLFFAVFRAFNSTPPIFPIYGILKEE
jgi:hypothetical protein